MHFSGLEDKLLRLVLLGFISQLCLIDTRQSEGIHDFLCFFP